MGKMGSAVQAFVFTENANVLKKSPELLKRA
jgi:hypothetical protein